MNNLRSFYDQIGIDAQIADNVLNLPRKNDEQHADHRPAVRLWSMMLDSSVIHIQRIKMSYWDFKDRNITWALRRAHFHVNRYPDRDEPLRFETYCHSTKRYFTYRDYKVYDREQKVIAWMTSEWLLMDTIRRSLCDITRTIGDLPDAVGARPIPFEFKQVPKIMEYNHETAYTITPDHIDFNDHVSNKVYLQWMYDQWSAVVHPGELQDFYIHYKNEITLDETIHLRCSVENPQNGAHYIVDEENKVLAQARSVWR